MGSLSGFALVAGALCSSACSLTGDELAPTLVAESLSEQRDAVGQGTDGELSSPNRPPEGESAGGDDTESGPEPVGLEPGVRPPASPDGCDGSEPGSVCSCSSCALGSACVVDADCRNDSCVAGTCAEAGCTDGVHNQDESDVDCGGAICAACPAGLGCDSDSDCEGDLFCAPGDASCSPQSCADAIQSGSELGVDCGGDCPGCPEGTACTSDADCASGVCGDSGSCSAPRCDDGVRNQEELDVDCAGSCAADCGTGQRCQQASDCTSRVCGSVGCAAGEALCCQVPRCDDGVRNAAEADVDCGTAACGGCALGDDCSADAQCQSGFCSGGSCTVRLVCGDGVRNGPETDLDCGGSEPGCPRCADGQVCAVASDCQSNRCAVGRCVSCFDGVQNGNEAGVDCGGSDPACPACIRCTDATSADLGAVGSVSTVSADGCVKISQFPSYSPTLLEAYETGPFPIGFSWRQDCTGAAGGGTFEHIYHQIPMSGLSTACPVFVELFGSAAPLSMRWW
jgi:hypothetical protein